MISQFPFWLFKVGTMDIGWSLAIPGCNWHECRAVILTPPSLKASGISGAGSER